MNQGRNRFQMQFTFKVKAYGDLSAATLALMDLRVDVGGDGALLRSLWRKTSRGWKLKQSDLF